MLAFLGGAVIGGALLEPLGNATIFVPVVALVVIATATVRVAATEVVRSSARSTSSLSVS